MVVGLQRRADRASHCNHACAEGGRAITVLERPQVGLFVREQLYAFVECCSTESLTKIAERSNGVMTAPGRGSGLHARGPPPTPAGPPPMCPTSRRWRVNDMLRAVLLGDLRNLLDIPASR